MTVLNPVDIPGWMSKEELDWLGEMARTAGTIVEIGSWQGRSTKALAQATRGSVFAVDDLTGEVKTPTTPEDLEKLFLQNLAAEIFDGKVHPIRMPSLEAASSFVDGSVDMVFIDGNHEAPHPKNDIDAWLPKLKWSGLMCGHDRFHPGVKEALSIREWEARPGSLWRLV